MISSIIKRDGRVVPFNRDKIAFAVYRAAVAVGGRDRAPAELVTDDVVALLERRAGEGAAPAGAGEPAAPPAATTSGAIPTVEEVQDLVEKVLIERGHARTAKAYIIYRYEHALKREGRPSLTYSVDNIPYKVLWETLSWAADHGCTRLADLAAAIDRGRYGDLIAAAEEFYRRQIDGAVAVISGREPRPRVVIVAGPSSSGKTTTTLKLRARLEQEGWRLFPIAVDNYFYDLELHPRDPHGDYDFETPQALNLELFSRDLARILAGEEVRIPHYDFKSGRQQLAAEPVQVDRDTVLLIDSLHGLYPALTAGIPDQLKVGVYVETLSQIKDAAGTFVRWSDIRMLRRMVRDVQFRNYGRSPDRAPLAVRAPRRDAPHHRPPAHRRRDRQQLPRLRTAHPQGAAGHRRQRHRRPTRRRRRQRPRRRPHPHQPRRRAARPAPGVARRARRPPRLPAARVHRRQQLHLRLILVLGASVMVGLARRACWRSWPTLTGQPPGTDLTSSFSWCQLKRQGLWRKAGRSPTH